MFKLLRIIFIAVCLWGGYVAYENYTKPQEDVPKDTIVMTNDGAQQKKSSRTISKGTAKNNQNDEEREKARIAKHEKSAIKHIFLAILPDKQEWPLPVQRFYTAFNLDEIVDPIRDNPNWVGLEDMSEEMPLALIAIEDHKFYEHGPIAFEAILRAALANIAAGEITQGGSTITQQLVKNICLTPEQSLERKVTEAVLSIAMEETYSKDEILELYLNTAYLGAGATGVRQAAHIYFAKTPAELNLAECAVLAALPYAPSALNPLENPEGCRRRQLLVLDTMLKRGLITSDELEEAKDTRVYLSNDSILK